MRLARAARREDAQNIAARLARALPLPASIDVVTIVNDGTPEQAPRACSTRSAQRQPLCHERGRPLGEQADILDPVRRFQRGREVGLRGFGR